MRARLRANWKRENARCRRATAQAAGEAQSQSDPAVDVHGAPLFPSTATSARRRRWLPTIGRAGGSVGSKEQGKDGEGRRRPEWLTISTCLPRLPIRKAPMGRRYRRIAGRNAPLMSGDTGPTAPTAAAIAVTLGQGPSACQTALRSSRHLLALRARAILWKAVQPKQRRACRWKSFRCVPALPPNCAG